MTANSGAHPAQPEYNLGMDNEIMANEQKQILIYTDGACDPNPGGPGGYGVVLIHGATRKELSGGFRATTNNRMEMYAAIQGLQALKTACRVTLYSDSEYLVKAMTQGWANRWKQRNWWRTSKSRAANVDLWEQLLTLCEKHQVEFVWVRGHAGNRENERCDQLSYSALKQADLPVDQGYENRQEEAQAPTPITDEGQPCRKCSTPVIKRRPRQKHRPGQQYYYEYYLYCPNCHTQYLVEDAKQPSGQQTLF